MQNLANEASRAACGPLFLRAFMGTPHRQQALCQVLPAARSRQKSVFRLDKLTAWAGCTALHLHLTG